MIFLKLFFRVNTILKSFFYLIIYRNRLKIGNNFSFRKGFSLIIDGEHGRVEIGDNCFFNNYCTIAAMDKITIGDNTLFGENVKIYDHNHKYGVKGKTIAQSGYTHDAIIIGRNCWIASHVVILKGVTIGDNCIIGAGCIVYKDVQEGTVLLAKQEQIQKKKNDE